MGSTDTSEDPMATVQSILARKTQERPTVVTVHADATVLEAVRLMAEHGIGGLPVLATDGAVAGIFTERDLLRRVVAAALDPAGTRVELVMTNPVVVATPATPLDECASVMTSRRLRHLPIVDGDRLVGMVTIGDVLALRAAEQEVTIAELNRYVFDLR
jgi:CBS domain-containing protein